MSIVVVVFVLVVVVGVVGVVRMRCVQLRRLCSRGPLQNPSDNDRGRGRGRRGCGCRGCRCRRHRCVEQHAERPPRRLGCALPTGCPRGYT